MTGAMSIEAFMTADHVSLAALLERSSRDPLAIDGATFAEFRAGLLRHIAMEEKVLLPFARDHRNGEPLPVAKKLREDHGKLAKLLVPTPTHATCAAIRELLRTHDALEEGPEGLYAEIDALAGQETHSVIERLRAQPAVPLAPYYDGAPHTAHRKDSP